MVRLSITVIIGRIVTTLYASSVIYFVFSSSLSLLSPHLLVFITTNILLFLPWIFSYIKLTTSVPSLLPKPFIVPPNMKVYPHDVDSNPHTSAMVCGKCLSMRPPRYHHCSVIDECVEEYDHFCEVLGVLVAKHNRRFFIIFLFWSFLILIFNFIFLALAEKRTFVEAFIWYISVYIGLGFVLTVGFLNFLHVTFVLNDVTSVEAHSFPCIFNRAAAPWFVSKKHSWRRVMGGSWVWWLPCTITNEFNDKIIV
ncbi:hypothetical protein RCL1_009110 [Eukaryota sp. TZLM3-RCL]